MTRKISRSVAKIHLGQLEFFSLGNLDSKRDWGHANDYVEVKQTPPLPHTSLEEYIHTHTNIHAPSHAYYLCLGVEPGSDVHIVLTEHVFPAHSRPQYAICMKPPVIVCQKRNGDREREGQREERESAACCEATECTLVSHNSPMSQIPSGPRLPFPERLQKKERY